MRQSRKEKAYYKIKSDIKEGILKGNEKIVEEKYANITGVSRTPLREAVRLLEMEGLVYSKTNIGVFVTEITNKDVNEIFEIKIAVEPLIYNKAFERITSKEIVNLENILNNAQQEFSKGIYANLGNLAEEFYKVIYNASKSNHCANVLRRLSSIQEVIRFRALNSNEVEIGETIKEYEDIFQALKKHDFNEYEKSYIRHLKKARERYTRAI